MSAGILDICTWEVGVRSKELFWQAVMDNDVNRKAHELLKDAAGAKKWVGYQVSLSTLESKVASLEAEKTMLEAFELSLRQEVEKVKHDRAEVVSKVVPYVAIELVNSDKLGMLVRKLASAFVFYGRCDAFEEVAKMKEPFDLFKVKGYSPSTPIEALLSKKPQSFQWTTPTRTLVPTPSKVTPATASVSHPQSPSPAI
nr:hypothetical protein [Tanacetum cinerariifolium]